jgi:SAM-dependent methyltransferase
MKTSLKDYLFICKSFLLNQSTTRTLSNLNLAKKEIFLSGKILDLGAGSLSGGSYLNFIKISKEAKVLRIDINEKIKPDYKIDFEKDNLPFDEDSIDIILIFNLLEHIYNHQFLVKESFRVLKPKGLMIGCAPFLLRFHPSPKDFFRYSEEALKKLFNEIGFQEIQIEYIGYGPFVAAYSQIEYVFPKILRPFVFLIGFLLDKIAARIKPILKDKYPLAFLFTLKK